jgi:hypothetical protein
MMTITVDEFCTKTDTLPQDWERDLKPNDKAIVHADGTVIFNTPKKQYQPTYEPEIRERIKRDVYLAT